MAAQKVRTHTRKTASGGTTTVRQHTRTGKPRKPLLSLGHAWKLARRSWAAGKRKRRGVAFVLGAAAVGEVGAFLTLRGAGLLLGTLGIIAVAVAVLLGMMTGLESSGTNHRRR
jgi:hypothetical protein